MNIVFFGTHQFAVHILAGLIADPQFHITLVVTQPDRPIGRNQALQPSPVALFASELGFPIAKHESLKESLILEQDPSFLETLRAADIAVVAQYGLIIPQYVLDLPKKGCINVHTSLLPKYRGASPIQTALINGETETGVTIMIMDKGMDTGAILLQQTVTIDPDDTYGTLEQKLIAIAAPLLSQAIEGYVSGRVIPQPQDNTLATTCRMLTRDDGRIDWQRSAQDIYNQFRGMTPWPGIWTNWEGKRLKLLSVRPTDLTLSAGIVQIQDKHMFIGCGNGSLDVQELQLEGKKAMPADVFAQGYRQFNGARLS